MRKTIMNFSSIRLSGSKRGRFNITPLIDVCFLLIIFFVLVCRYIVAENFPVAVPDKCRFAQSDRPVAGNITTVTVMKTSAQGKIAYAVGPQIITTSAPDTIAAQIAHAIDARLKNSPADRQVVCLRAGKDVPFSQAQYALAGIAQSTATGLQLAVFKSSQSAGAR